MKYNLLLRLQDNSFIEIEDLKEICKVSNEQTTSIKEDFSIPIYSNIFYIFKGVNTLVSILGREIKYIKIDYK